MRPAPLKLVTAVLCSIYTIFCLVGAATASAGLAQTCKQFESVSGSSCGEIFSSGFLYNGDPSVEYLMDLGTTIAAINSCWILTVCYLLYSGLEWMNYRYDTAKWW